MPKHNNPAADTITILKGAERCTFTTSQAVFVKGSMHEGRGPFPKAAAPAIQARPADVSVLEKATDITASGSRVIFTLGNLYRDETTGREEIISASLSTVVQDING